MPAQARRHPRISAEPAGIASIAFDRLKYGFDLAVDAGEAGALPNYITGPRPHRLHFYELVLLRNGHGSVDRDGHNIEVRRARVLCTAPGEVRCWRLDARLDGLVVCFLPELFDAFFVDAGFVERLPFFGGAAAQRVLDLAPAAMARLQAVALAMIDELRSPRRDSAHLLRALLYQALVQLAREVRAVPATAQAPLPRRFSALMERQFRQARQVADYARQLGVSPARLHASLHAAFGQGPSALIQQRRFLEARRLLLYGPDSVAAVARQLGFRDASYFNRFFRRMAGCTPLAFRRGFGQHQESGEK